MKMTLTPPKYRNSTKGERQKFWEDVIEWYGSSRQSRAVFCRHHNLKPEELSRWMTRLRRRARKAKGVKKSQEKTQGLRGLVPVQVTPELKRASEKVKSPEQTAPLILDFQNGLRLCLSNSFEESSLWRVLDILERRSC